MPKTTLLDKAFRDVPPATTTPRKTISVPIDTHEALSKLTTKYKCSMTEILNMLMKIALESAPKTETGAKSETQLDIREDK